MVRETRSNHYVGPEPVRMTRSGVSLLNDLIESDQVEDTERGSRRESTNASVDGVGYQGRLRSRSGERLAAMSGSKDTSKTRSLSRAASSGGVFDQHYGSRADRSRSSSRGLSSRMTNEERQFATDPFDRKRSYRGKREFELEDQRKDEELRRMGKRAWTSRSAWHPLSILNSIVSSSRRLWLIILVILVVGGTIAGLLTFFLWPRPLRIQFIDLEHDKNPLPYRVIPREDGIHLRVQSWMRVRVLNPNYFGGKIVRSQVVASWVKVGGGGKEMFGGSSVDAVSQIGGREGKELRLPVTIEYMGSPLHDPIYADFLERCYKKKDGFIKMEWEVQVTTVAKEVERTGTIVVEREVPCPIGADMIDDALRKLKIDPAKLSK